MSEQTNLENHFSGVVMEEANLRMGCRKWRWFNNKYWFRRDRSSRCQTSLPSLSLIAFEFVDDTIRQAMFLYKNMIHYVCDG